MLATASQLFIYCLGGTKITDSVRITFYLLDIFVLLYFFFVFFTEHTNTRCNLFFKVVQLQ